MLRITRETDYGLVLLAHLAGTPRREVLPARDLAERIGLSVPMASKILKVLAREGLVVSERGVKGGYGLAASPEEISLGDVIQALEGPIGMTECTTTPGSCGLEPACPARFPWQRVSEALMDVLKGIPLSEMLRTREGSQLIRLS